MLRDYSNSVLTNTIPSLIYSDEMTSNLRIILEHLFTTHEVLNVIIGLKAVRPNFTLLTVTVSVRICPPHHCIAIVLCSAPSLGPLCWTCAQKRNFSCYTSLTQNNNTRQSQPNWPWRRIVRHAAIRWAIHWRQCRPNLCPCSNSQFHLQ